MPDYEIKVKTTCFGSHEVEKSYKMTCEADQEAGRRLLVREEYLKNRRCKYKKGPFSPECGLALENVDVINVGLLKPERYISVFGPGK